VWTPVTALYRKSTVLPSLPGRQVTPTLVVTDNHLLSDLGRAGDTTLPRRGVPGDVFDLETETRNFVAGGIVLEAANSASACQP
jgi:hypothetical protein